MSFRLSTARGSFTAIAAAILVCALPAAQAANPEPAPAAASSAAIASPRLTTEDFARLPVMRSVSFSPDGKTLAALVNKGDETILVTRDVAGGPLKPVLKTDNKAFIFNWFAWKGNERLLLSLRYPSSRQISVARTVDTMETRLLSVRPDGSELKNVIKHTDRSLRWAVNQDQVVDGLRDDPEHILLALPDSETAEGQERAVFKVNLSTGRRSEVQASRSNTYEWLTDATHRVRVGVRYLEGETEIIACDPKGDNWRTLWKFKAFDGDFVHPLGFGLDPQKLYVAANHQGLKAVFLVDLADPALPKTLVFADPKRDVAGRLVRSAKTGEVVGLNDPEASEAGSTYWDPSYKALVAGIDKALPERINYLLQVSPDESRYVIYSTGNGIPGQLLLGDRKSGQLGLLADTAPQLDADRIAKKASITITARDGLKLPAFLTLPLGAEPKKLPLVVLPHGGPEAADDIAYDPWVAAIANMGYAVVQVNFRGSAGYGQAHLEAGLRRWGLEMQDDITDTAQSLVKQGIADPDRLAIVGGSYGGYAALEGVIKTPELFKAAVAFAPVTDLVELTRQFGKWDPVTITRRIGSPTADKERLLATSPRFHADKIQVPVLLVHGTTDRQAPYEHGEWMAEALKKANKRYTFISQAHGDHQLSHQVYRSQFLKETEAFLKQHLGPGVAPKLAVVNAATDNAVVAKGQ